MQLYITLGNGHYYWDTSSPIRLQTFLLRSETLSGPEKNKGSFLHFHEMPFQSLVFFFTLLDDGILVFDLGRHILGGAMSAYYNSSCIIQHWKTTTPEMILKIYQVENFQN